ncbi:MAG: carboxypeptidase regulatory-like domain-containing protein, partial [Methanoregula sp.]
MNIELDGVPLFKADTSPQGGQTEIRNVYNISTTDKRDMIGHKIPGMEGDVFQNLGRSPVVISFDGTFQGKTAKENLEILRTKFKQGTPLPFNSDISGAADITHVLINDLRIEESADVIGKYHYFMVLQEYKVPPPEPVMPPAQDEEAAAWQEETAGEVVDSLNVITGRVLDAEGNPKAGVTVTVTGDSGEYSVDTDDEGLYRIEDVTPGTYTVKVDSEEYEGSEEEVTVGRGESEEGSGEGAGESEEGSEEGTTESGESSGKQNESSDEDGSAGKSEDTGSAGTTDTEPNDKDSQKSDVGPAPDQDEDKGKSRDTDSVETKDTEAKDKDSGKSGDTGSSRSDVEQTGDTGKSRDTDSVETKDTEAKDKDSGKSRDTDSVETKDTEAKDKVSGKSGDTDSSRSDVEQT